MNSDSDSDKNMKSSIRGFLSEIRSSRVPLDIAQTNYLQNNFSALIEVTLDPKISTSERKIALSLFKSININHLPKDIFQKIFNSLLDSSLPSDIRRKTSECLSTILLIVSDETVYMVFSYFISIELESKLSLEGVLLIFQVLLAEFCKLQRRETLPRLILSDEIGKFVDFYSKLTCCIMELTNTEEKNKLMEVYWSKLASKSVEFIYLFDFPSFRKSLFFLIAMTECPFQLTHFKAEVFANTIEISSFDNQDMINEKLELCLEFKEQQLVLLLSASKILTLSQPKSFLRLLSVLLDYDSGREVLSSGQIFRDLYFSMVRPYLSLNKEEIESIKEQDWEELMNYAKDICHDRLSQTTKTFAFNCLYKMTYHFSYFLQEISQAACVGLSLLIDPTIETKSIDKKHLSFLDRTSSAETLLLILASLSPQIKNDCAVINILNNFFSLFSIPLVLKFKENKIVFARFCSLFAESSEFILIGDDESFSKITEYILSIMVEESDFDPSAFSLNLAVNENRVRSFLSSPEKLKLLFDQVQKTANPHVFSLFHKVIIETKSDFEILILNMLDRMNFFVSNKQNPQVVSKTLDILDVLGKRLLKISSDTENEIDSKLVSIFNSLISSNSEFLPEFISFSSRIMKHFNKSSTLIRTFSDSFEKVFVLCEGNFDCILEFIYSKQHELIPILKRDTITEFICNFCFQKRKISDHYSIYIILKLLSSNDLPYVFALKTIKEEIQGKCDDIFLLIMNFDLLLDCRESSIESRAKILIQQNVTIESFIQVYLKLLLLSNFDCIHIFRNLNLWILKLIRSNMSLMTLFVKFLIYNFKKLNKDESEYTEINNIKEWILNNISADSLKELLTFIKEQVEEGSLHKNNEFGKYSNNPNIVKFLSNNEMYVFKMKLQENEFSSFRDFLSEQTNLYQSYDTELQKDIKFVNQIDYYFNSEKKKWFLRRFVELKKKKC